MRKLLIKPILLSLVCSLSLYAGTYDDSYSPLMDQKVSANVKPDIFMDGDFKQIKRFDMLWFDGDSLSSKYKTHLKEIINNIKETSSKGERILVTIIGHTNEPTDDMNEVSVQSRAYASKIQRWFRYSLDSKTSMEKSKKYALKIQDALVDGGIDKNVTVVEYRGGKDMFFNDATTEGRDLSNRVMVTMYILNPEEKDSDGDGVLDIHDKCPDTPKGVKVDKEGCTIVVAPIVSSVVINDSDGDGTPDSLDKCPNTPKNSVVDVNGCPITQNLSLNFATNSSEISKESYPKVVSFADFLKKNPMYKVQIIGHTDSIGSYDANMKLSQARAMSVKTALIHEGVEASRITSDGRGELDPIADDTYASGREANRRIEAKLLY
ncbi:MAG: OmpA family protein [Thiovulaceae bacterium]|nr:OmpA family protein [Sulfurimonadaceae bacterium]